MYSLFAKSSEYDPDLPGMDEMLDAAHEWQAPWLCGRVSFDEQLVEIIGQSESSDALSGSLHLCLSIGRWLASLFSFQLLSLCIAGAIRLWNHGLGIVGMNANTFIQQQQEGTRDQADPTAIYCWRDMAVFLHSLNFSPGIQRWDVKLYTTRTITLYKLQSIPCAWPAIEPSISQIYWPPSIREKEEGTWREVRKFRIKSNPWTMDTDPQQRMENSLHSILVDAQGDHGLKSLMANRSKRAAGLRRACSMPNLLRITGEDTFSGPGAHGG